MPTVQLQLWCQLTKNRSPCIEPDGMLIVNKSIMYCSIDSFEWEEFASKIVALFFPRKFTRLFALLSEAPACDRYGNTGCGESSYSKEMIEFWELY